MQARLNLDQALSFAAVAIGLVVGIGVVGTGASVAPGCAAAECQSPRNEQRPASVLECPSGTLCYQGACVPSCASGSERVEKCDSDDDCTSGVRPNCVDRRCSACEQGERCIPALDICSPIRANVDDGGLPDPSPTKVPAVSPLDGGQIDGSPLAFDGGEGPGPDIIDLTHVLSIEAFQRINLVSANTASVGIDIVSLDLRGTGRVPSSTVGPLVFSSGDECAVRLDETYTIQRPVPFDLGTIQLQADTGPLERARGLAADYVATYMNGRYTVSPGIAANTLLFFSTTGDVRGTQISGVGAPPVTLGRWPEGTDAPELVSPDVFALSTPSQNALRAIDATGPDPFFELAWTKGIPLPGSRVLVTVGNGTCTLRCTFDEADAQLRVTSRTIRQFRDAPCNARGSHDIIVERSVGSVLDVRSNFDADYAVRATAEIAHGYIGRITF